MTQPRHSALGERAQIAADLEPGLATAERDALVDTGVALRRDRPAPRAAFRTELRRVLLSGTASRGGMTTALRRRAVAFATGGGALLVVAAAGALGSGPVGS